MFSCTLIMNVGGDLPESKLQDFLDRINIYLPKVDSRGKHTKAELLKIHGENLAGPFQYDTLTNDETNYTTVENMEKFCDSNHLTYLKHCPPHIATGDEYFNEMLSLKRPGMDEVHVPTNGEQEPVCNVDDVFSTIEAVFDNYEQSPQDRLPLVINNPGIQGDVARLRLQGEPLRKILTEVLRSRVGYPDLNVPPFRIIKGK